MSRSLMFFSKGHSILPTWGKKASLLLHMSHAFDMVRTKELSDVLREILDEDEIHMINILVEDVKLTVRVGKNLGNKITTNIGVPQGGTV